MKAKFLSLMTLLTASVGLKAMTITATALALGAGYAMTASLVNDDADNGDGAPVEAAVYPSLIYGEETIALNDHVAVSAESAEAITVSFDGIVPAEASYTVSSLYLVAGEESSSWEVNETLAEGALMLSGKGYADFNAPIVFEQGTKYQVAITYKTMDPNDKGTTLTYDVNGAYVEPAVTSVDLFKGSEQTTLNTHSAVSVSSFDAIKVHFGNAAAVESANVAISPLVMQETEEGYTWVPGVPTMYDLSINTIGYAEMNCTLEQGCKYQLDVNVNLKDGSSESVSYQIDGATEKDVKLTEVIEVDGDKNSLEIVFAEEKDVALSYNVAVTLNGQEINNNCEGDYDQWNKINVSGLELEDGEYTLVFPVGSLVIGGEDNEVEYTVKFNVENGKVSTAAPAVLPSLIINNVSVDLNSHMAASVEAASELTVAFDGVIPAKATYAICEMHPVVGAESTTWEAGDAVAEGEFQLSGKAFAQFEAPVAFAQGTKYQLTVTYWTADPNDAGQTFTCEFNGTYYNEVSMALISGEELIDVPNIYVQPTVTSAEAVKIYFEDASVQSATYSLAPMVVADDINNQTGANLGQAWVAGAPIAEGNVGINGFGYADFGSVVNFEEGKLYQLTIKAVKADNSTIVTRYFINGASASSATDFVMAFSIEDNAEVDMAQTHSINVNVKVDGMTDEDLFIQGNIYGKDGSVTPFTGYTDFEDGVDVNISRLAPNASYTLEVTQVAYGEITGFDEETYMPIYSNNYVAEEGKSLASVTFYLKGATEEPQITNTVVNPNNSSVFVHFDTEDANVTYNPECPIILLNEAGMPVDVTVEGAYGQDYGDMVYTFSQALSAGKYEIVLSAGSMTFSLNGDPYMAELRVPFTIEGATEEPQITNTVVNPNNSSVFVHFDTEDANVTYNPECPIVLLNEAGMPVDVTVEGAYGQDYGDMVYTFSQALSAGKYEIVLSAGSMTFSLNGDPYMAELRVPFTIEGAAALDEPQVTTIFVNPNNSSVFVHFDTEDANVTYNPECPMTLEDAQGNAFDIKVEGAYGQDYGDMIYTFSQALEPGDYQIVLSAGSMTFSLNGDPYMAEIRVAFTVASSNKAPETTGIAGVNGSKVADGKYLVNGKIVIMKQGVRYNTAGSRVAK